MGSIPIVASSFSGGIPIAGCEYGPHAPISVPALNFVDWRTRRENSERGVAQFGVVEESPCLVHRVADDGDGQQPLKILCSHVAPYRSWVGDDRTEKGDIANVPLGVGVVVNSGGLDHDGPEHVWPRHMNNTIAVANGDPFGSLQCLCAASDFDGCCCAGCAQVGAAAESVRPEDVDVYGATLERWTTSSGLTPADLKPRLASVARNAGNAGGRTRASITVSRSWLTRPGSRPA